jgi:hypothetical protein
MGIMIALSREINGEIVYACSPFRHTVAITSASEIVFFSTHGRSAASLLRKGE